MGKKKTKKDFIPRRIRGDPRLERIYNRGFDEGCDGLPLTLAYLDPTDSSVFREGFRHGLQIRRLHCHILKDRFLFFP